MRRHLLAIVLLSVLATTPASGLYGIFPNDKPVDVGGWPPAIGKAINEHRRVHGGGTDEFGHGWTFYFVGNTDDLNRFLATVAEAKDVPLSLVLDPDAGATGVIGLDFGKLTPIEYSWSLHLVPMRERLIVFERNPGETQAQYDQRVKKEREAMPEYSAEVTVHATGPIAATRLKIPLAFRTSVGGELSKFAEVHNRRREEAKKPDSRPDANRPTVHSDTKRGGGLFGGGPDPATLPKL